MRRVCTPLLNLLEIVGQISIAKLINLFFLYPWKLFKQVNVHETTVSNLIINKGELNTYLCIGSIWRCMNCIRNSV